MVESVSSKPPSDLGTNPSPIKLEKKEKLNPVASTPRDIRKTESEVIKQPPSLPKVDPQITV